MENVYLRGLKVVEIGHNIRSQEDTTNKLSPDTPASSLVAIFRPAFVVTIGVFLFENPNLAMCALMKVSNEALGSMITNLAFCETDFLIISLCGQSTNKKASTRLYYLLTAHRDRKNIFLIGGVVYTERVPDLLAIHDDAATENALNKIKAMEVMNSRIGDAPNSY
jgi:hypothetical protein